MATNKGAKYATSFEEIWLSNPNYQDRKIKMICQKTFSISTMGECTIKSHTKLKMHLSRKPISSGIASFF